MDYATYEVEAQVEATHWWFVGRRKLFISIIQQLKLPITSEILDIGTSTGTNLRMLSEAGYSNVRGLDMSDDAIRWCKDKGLGTVQKGDVCNIPSADNTYDFILSTDIIEHVDDDYLALKDIYRVLKPGASVLITVPAFQSLWGLQDEVSHHKRRYLLKELNDKLMACGFVVKQIYYFNYLLFLPIYIARKLIAWLKIKVHSENEINSDFINYVMAKIFELDIKTARFIKPPFGVSVLALATKV